jgi:hypothetical protein
MEISGDCFYWNIKDSKVYFISHEDVESPTIICNSVDDFFEILNKNCEEPTIISNLNSHEIINIQENVSKDYKKIFDL